MFGHQDDKQDDNQDDELRHDETATDITPDQPADDNQQDDNPAAPADDGGQDGGDEPQAQVANDDEWQHPGEPIDENPGQISDIIAPAGGQAQNPVPPMPLNARDLPNDEDAKTPHELIDIKQKALNQLTPLMSQLDQTPEDRFRTLLMIIQASDNQDMIKQAYDVANDIKDEKVRAQALLDLVNEINYFTQHPAA